MCKIGRLIIAIALSLIVSTSLFGDQSEKWICDDGFELEQYDDESGDVRYDGLKIKTKFWLNGIRRIWGWEFDDETARYVVILERYKGESRANILGYVATNECDI